MRDHATTLERMRDLLDRAVREPARAYTYMRSVAYNAAAVATVLGADLVAPKALIVVEADMKTTLGKLAADAAKVIDRQTAQIKDLTGQLETANERVDALTGDAEDVAAETALQTAVDSATQAGGQKTPPPPAQRQPFVPPAQRPPGAPPSPQIAR